MLFGCWSPDAHAHFPHTFREQVFALLLCHGAWETGRTLGKLPKELLYVIVEHHARPFSIPVMRQLSAAVREGGIADVSTAHMDHILNRLLCARLELQEAFLCTAEMLEARAHQASTDTLSSMPDRAGPASMLAPRTWDTATSTLAPPESASPWSIEPRNAAAAPRCALLSPRARQPERLVQQFGRRL